MSQKIRFVTASSILFLLMGCTAQEKQVLHELESMPGITCEVDDQGEQQCHPDNPATITDNN